MKKEELGPHDRSTVEKISEFLKRYLERYEPPMQEFDAREIVRRYQNDILIFEIPTKMIGDSSSREELEHGVHQIIAMIIYTHTPPLESLVEDQSNFLS